MRLHIELLIKQIRKQKNITLDELSKRSGVSKTHINDIENNRKEPTLSIAVSIAKALDVQLTDLFKVTNQYFQYFTILSKSFARNVEKGLYKLKINSKINLSVFYCCKEYYII